MKSNRSQNEPADFGIVIPVGGQSKDIDASLTSILAQEGSATVHIHVQASSSEAGARAKVQTAQKKLDEPRFRITYSEKADSGPAEGINNGLRFVRAKYLTWLGAGDILLPGCIPTLQQSFASFPDIEWITGQPQILSEMGTLVSPHGRFGNCRLSRGYSSKALALGLHMTRWNHGVIQQEGTFWTRELWEKAGGLNPDFRYAFDFDLWCRMAVHASLVEFIGPLAAFRSDPGQVSSNAEGWADEKKRIRQRTFAGKQPATVAWFIEPTEVLFVGSRDGRLERRQSLFVGFFRPRAHGEDRENPTFSGSLLKLLTSLSNLIPPIRGLLRRDR